MKKIALIINTVSECSDIWPMFFGQLNKLFPDLKSYVFVDEPNQDIPQDCEIITYNSQQKYSDQFLSCIKQVKEEFCIYIAEDYILYESP